ncbi:MAG TPA: hypothetical protein PKK25_11920 [Deltaproteobacteria bacterium]|nr:hypothetical protein [Deltaproteobacteria bacterium]
MKIKVFLLVFAGAVLMLVLSSAMVYTQMRSVRAVNLDTLTESLFKEDAKVLSWILSSVPPDRIDTLRLPESWAEIFLVEMDNLQLSASTNQAHRGIPLYRHPLLLDQASVITDAMKRGTSATANTPSYMVIVEPAGAGRFIVALKPKAWERMLVEEQTREIESRTRGITVILAVFLAAGLLLALLVSFMVMSMVVTPIRRSIDALEALSLGNFDYDLHEASGREMAVFSESYLRLKASLELALAMITRK